MFTDVNWVLKIFFMKVYLLSFNVYILAYLFDLNMFVPYILKICLQIMIIFLV